MEKTIYYSRIADKLLNLKLRAFGATSIVGPKWCGKTMQPRPSRDRRNQIVRRRGPHLRRRPRGTETQRDHEDPFQRSYELSRIHGICEEPEEP